MTTRPDDWEALSALLSGDLPPDAAARLRERLRQEPELERAFSQMAALPEALTALPLKRPPERLLEPTPARAVWPYWTLGASGALFAAAAVLALFVGLSSAAPAAEQVLVEGTELVEGQAVLVAGGRRLEVDGRARITVEPAHPVPRETGAEVSMGLSHWVAAGAGGVVTVVVFEGTVRAWALTGDGAIIEDQVPIDVVAGEQRVLGTPRQAAMTRQVGTEAAAAADQRVAALAQELKQAKMEAALAKGQLALYQGEVQDFPADTPLPLDAAHFRETFEKAMAAAGTPATLLDTDCSEFPCIAYLKPTGGLDAHDAKELSQVADDLGKQHYGEDGSGVLAMGTVKETDEGTIHVMALALMPTDDVGGPTQQRVQTRVQDFTESQEPEPHAEDVEVTVGRPR